MAQFALYRSGFLTLRDRLRNGRERRPAANIEEHALSSTRSRLHYSQSDSNLVGAAGRKERKAYEREQSSDWGGCPGRRMLGKSGEGRQPAVVIKLETHTRVDVAEGNAEDYPGQASHRFRDDR